jgi:CDP-paratose 2-epimerase
MTKLLITGCAGFIGSHLSRHFLEQGDLVFGLDNLSRRGTHENLDYLRDLGTDRFVFFKADIRDFALISTIFKEHGPFDLVIHEAGQVAVTNSIVDPRSDFEINALGTFNLLEATRLYSPKAFFEFASTNKVYGEMAEVPVCERNGRYDYETLLTGVTEKQTLDFHSPYGCSKGTADQYVRDYSRIFGLKTVVLRQSCIFGDRQFGIEDQGWVSWFTIAALLNKQITIYGDGKQCRDILWIDDLVAAYQGLYDNREQVAGEVFNVGGGSSNILSINELISMLTSRNVLTMQPNNSAWRDGDQKIFSCDISKLQSYIDWRPLVSPAEGVNRLITWVEANRTLISDILG